MNRLHVVTSVILSAICLVLAFPRASIYPLVFIALVPGLYVSSRVSSRAAAFRLGWATGFLSHLGILWWIARLYPTEITYPGLRLPALILLAAFEGLFYGVAFWGWRVVAHTSRWWLWPGLWVSTEFARSLTSLAFPWTVLANALSAQPIFMQPAALGGVWLLDLGLGTIAMLLSRAVDRVRYAPIAAAVILVWAGAGARIMGRDIQTVGVGIVQPNALPEFKWHEGGRTRVFRDLEALSQAAAESLGHAPASFLVWPETAIPMVVRPGGGAEFWLTRLVDELGVPLVTGALGTVGEDEFRMLTNTAVAVQPDRGITGRYDKLHLVPFSEKMPFSDWIPAIKRLNFGQGDYARGTAPVVLDVDGVKVSVLICFEAILPGLVRRHVAEGAEVLVNITNDSWFGQSGAPEQHAAIAVMRAVEHRRWLVRAANSGVSLIADPWGRVVTKGGLFRPEVLTGSIRPRLMRTPYSVVGDWVAWFGVLATGIIMAGAVFRR